MVPLPKNILAYTTYDPDRGSGEPAITMYYLSVPLTIKSAVTVSRSTLENRLGSGDLEPSWNCWSKCNAC